MIPKTLIVMLSSILLLGGCQSQMWVEQMTASSPTIGLARHLNYWMHRDLESFNPESEVIQQEKQSLLARGDQLKLHADLFDVRMDDAWDRNVFPPIQDTHDRAAIIDQEREALLADWGSFNQHWRKTNKSTPTDNQLNDESAG